MNRERKLSVLAGRASKVIGLKRPSELIPFRGNFPLLEPHQINSYYEAVRSTDDIEDLSEEFQKATESGNRIVLLEDGFKQYLSRYGITVDKFINMSNSDKSDKLIDWMNRDCIDFSQLKIN